MEGVQTVHSREEGRKGWNDKVMKPKAMVPPDI